MQDNLKKNITRLAEQLTSRGIKLATAESCTGGWIAQQATALSGSSNWFEAGFVTYSNEAKQSMLGVQLETLEAQGAVSEAVVIEMAEGAIRRSNAQISVAVSGVAGPDGGTLEKPVGTVWIAWLSGEGNPVARCFHFGGDREAVRMQALEQAICGLLRLIEEKAP